MALISYSGSGGGGGGNYSSSITYGYGGSSSYRYDTIRKDYSDPDLEFLGVTGNGSLKFQDRYGRIHYATDWNGKFVGALRDSERYRDQKYYAYEYNDECPRVITTSMTTTALPAAPKKEPSALDWLNEQVESVCRLARSEA